MSQGKRKRAPRVIGKEVAAEIYRLILLVAPTKAQGGAQAVLRGVLLGGDGSAEQMEEYCSLFSDGAAKWWRAKVAWHQQQLTSGEESWLSHRDARASEDLRRVAASIRAHAVIDGLREAGGETP